MARKTLNRKQRSAIRRERCSLLNFEDTFFTHSWTVQDWQLIPSRSDGWTAKPDRERFFVVRIKCVRFSDGTRARFYQVVARPEARREWEDLRKRAKALLAECRQEITSAIVRSERRLIKQPYRGRKKAKR